MEMQSNPTALPAAGYPGPGFQAPQVPYGLPQYIPGSVFPGQPASTFLSHQIAYGALPVQAQPSVPAPVIWMPAPPAPPKCPPGLECLSQTDQLLIQQQIEFMEMISGYETCNRYEIKNTLGQWMYFAAEENDDFTLNCYGPLRPFTIRLFDSTQQAVMQLTRPFHCSVCCCPCCCLQELEVEAPLGTIIGYVKQRWHPYLPKFAIQNEGREDVLKMDGPFVPCRFFENVDFEVKSVDEKFTVGRISKQWAGMAREAATDASIFGIQFPGDLDINMKALVLGSCFLIDFMFFERGHQNQRRGSQFS